MHKSRVIGLLVLLALICIWVAPAVAAEKAAPGNSPAPSIAPREEVEGFEEPDLPAFLRDRIDKVEFMMLRNEAIGQKRGLPYHTPFNPRVKAIREMEAVTRSPGHQHSPDISETSWTEIGPNPIPNGQTTTV